MSKPLFCPNCRAALPDGPKGAQPFTSGADGAWDCYCGGCKWSGDIMPDDEEGAAGPLVQGVLIEVQDA